MLSNNRTSAPLGFLAVLGAFFQASHIASALGDLVDRFKVTGQAREAESWVSDRPNMLLNVEGLKVALRAETIAALAQKTGLSQAELLLRLNVALPDMVNRFTPEGRLPSDAQSNA
jgi:uncharacterized protein YidB (DUF937 family)